MLMKVKKLFDSSFRFSLGAKTRFFVIPVWRYVRPDDIDSVCRFRPRLNTHLVRTELEHVKISEHNLT